MTETVSLDFDLKSPIEHVWHALTDSATLSKWMFFETSDFQPVRGHKFQFRGKPGSGGWIIDCEILEVEEPRRLSYTWVVGSAPQAWGPGSAHSTTITWTLTESAQGATRLHLEQSGFDSEAKQEIGGAKYGWTAQLGQLQNLLAGQ